MNSSAATFYSTDLRPVLALAILCVVALAPAGAGAAEPAGAPAPSLAAAVAEVPFVATTNSFNIIAGQIEQVNEALVDVASAYLALFALDAVPQAAAVGTANASAAGESLVMTLVYLPESLYETVGKTTDFLAAVEMAPMYVISDALSQALFDAGLY